MTYHTPHGSVNIRGRKLVIEANDAETTISMLEGESRVRAGALDLGGQTLKSGQQAVIRRGAPGEPSQILIRPIPPRDAPALDDKVAMACMAKKTVYFEERERTETGDRKGAGTESTGSTGESGTGEGANGRISAFDGDSGGTSSVTIREIVPVPVIPANLPTDHIVSPASLVTPTRTTGG